MPFARFLLLAVALVSLLAPAAIAGPPAPDCCPPEYDQTVMQSYRKLKVQSSVYETLPEQGKGVRLGIYQAQAAYGPGASASNMDRLEQTARTARALGVQLLAFPELYVPGYTLSPQEARNVAEFADGPSISRARSLAQELGMAMLVPYAEKAETEAGLQYFDSIAVIDVQGELLTSYRKTHLYAQQERDNWAFGSAPPPVFKANGLPVGVLNCYENEFPELSRLLALQGAKLIVGPTAADCYYRMPDGNRSAVPYPDISTVLLPAFAYANNVFFAYANRCGVEKRGGDAWHYRGNSIIIGPHADVVVQANHRQDTLLVADCIPEYYGRTHPETGFGYLKDRRPDLYKPLVAPRASFLPGGWDYPTFVDGQEKGRGK